MDAEKLLRVVTGIAALAVVPACVAVAIRALSFLLDPVLSATLFLAPALSPPDLIFLGAQFLVISPAAIPLLLLAFSLLLFRPHRRRLRAARDFKEASARLKSRGDRLSDLASRALREALSTQPRTAQVDRDITELEKGREAQEEDLRKLDEAYEIIQSVELPSDTKTYPIEALGLRFSSIWSFLMILAAVAYFLGATLLVSPFPAGFVGNITWVVAFVFFMRTVLSGDDLSVRNMLPTAVVLLGGVILAGAVFYRLPTGTYQWVEGTPLVPGRYAVVGESGGTSYVVPCHRQHEGVIATNSDDVLRALFPPIEVAEGTTSSLWGVIADGEWPLPGVLARSCQ